MSTTTIRSEFLGRELVNVALPQSYLVSDHPVAVGGTGKGPSPGEMLLAGYAAESVFGVRDQADRAGMQISPITVRTSFRADRERVDGPLPALGFLGRITRRVEIGSDKPIDDPGMFAVEMGIHKSLANGIEIDERVEFSKADDDMRENGWANETLRTDPGAVAGLTKGVTVQGTEEGRWRVSASEICRDLALVQLAGTPILVSRDGSMNCPSPHDLFLAALGTCTTIYVARNAIFCDAPIASVAVEVTAERPASLEEPTRNIDKVSWIASNMSDEDAVKCKFFSDFCAIGETMKRGVEMVGDVIVTDAVTAAGDAALTAFNAPAPPPALACDDGECCVT